MLRNGWHGMAEIATILPESSLLYQGSPFIIPKKIDFRLPCHLMQHSLPPILRVPLVALFIQSKLPITIYGAILW